MSAPIIYRPDPITGELRPVSAADQRAFFARRAAKKVIPQVYGLWDDLCQTWRHTGASLADLAGLPREEWEIPSRIGRGGRPIPLTRQEWRDLQEVTE